ncbi:glycosyltransferase [Gloeothece verrucosa]|uniref:Beta-monoglucosyldiacylglycerol synthase n=1 Tax=Gloeothece verrucosa (strain PCC 7822) TaxID=497965 RepID=E0UEY3_GLOV7|nr:glycosyltransferase family 2 protein [Gloeothece verrucosa]ADN13113.1 glycosyl transferase family 2 [Gloeothece verrucosa PCC 7822]
MPQNYWTDNDPDKDLDPISSLLSEWTDPEDEEEEFRSDFFQGLSGRRQKAAFMLTVIWGVTIGLHLVSWGTWVIMALTTMVVIQFFRLVTAVAPPVPEPLSDQALADAPSVSLLVAAKNEEAVIGNLVNLLCNLDYPTDKYEVWIIDDYSTDKTPQILDNLAQQYPQLKVMHRAANAGGGKSGALNQVLPLIKGEIIGVFDADAKVSADLLRRVVPLFEAQEMGAVQVSKAIANASVNFWTKGQMAEMALDSYFQQKRIAIDGVGELRGNGQFVRRSALQRCGQWNEQTITDDLDLTMRLHLDNWKIGFLVEPVVEEEGVTSAIALWHQRNRWAEGGYQRYLDYWRLILHTPMGLKKKVDLFFFIVLQYLLPTAAIPDLLMTLTRHRVPLFSPVSGLALGLSCWGMYSGLKRIRKNEPLSFADLLTIAWQTLRGTFYMIHWFIVIPSVTARMSIRPKRLKWVKTVHEGTPEESFEF